MNHNKWVATWGNAISVAERKPENYGKNLTLRYPVRSQLEGNAVRIKLDNFCGNEPVKVSAASVGTSTDKLHRITFNGFDTVEISQGTEITSDAVELEIKRGDNIIISLYFEDFTELRSGVFTSGPLSNGFFAVGNHAFSNELPINESKKTNWFYFLSEVDVLTSDECRCIVCYGDSITAQAWPDYLVQMNIENGNGKTSFVRKAASGTRILRQYDNITYDSYGLKGENRFPHEMNVSGADTVIIQQGINDIIHPVGTDVNPFRPWSDLPTSQEMIDGLKYYLDYAKNKSLKVYFGTLLPIENWRTYEKFRDDLRNEVNSWIRNNTESDGFIDFDEELCDKNNRSAFLSEYDSGDHLHPSQNGYKKMSEIVPKELYI